MTPSEHDRLVQLDHAHVWHPFTPMQQWRERDPLIIAEAQGFELIDTKGNRYVDGVSSLWCNVHGHRVPEIDEAIRQQLDKAAHTTLLGLASPPSIELAARLVNLVNRQLKPRDETAAGESPDRKLSKVFYSDAGATALEVAFKMAVGYWFHNGKPDKKKFIGLDGAYHGDTTGSMSVGYSDLFHRAFKQMTFEVAWFPTPDACRPPEGFVHAGHCNACERKEPGTVCANVWPSHCSTLHGALGDYCLEQLERMLAQQAEYTAAVVIEPVMQGAAGMVCQPAGFVKRVRELCDAYDVLMIADEVATGFGRTGEMFACAHDRVTPDLLCLAKGLTGGYLPVAVTMCTDAIEQAFCGELDDRKTLYHGHTYTGNPLGCAAALATLDLFEREQVIAHAQQSAELIRERLDTLRDHPNILDIRQRGLMVGIELCKRKPHAGEVAEPFDFAAQVGHAICRKVLEQGVWIRPLGNILVLMPAPAMDHDTIGRMLDAVVQVLEAEAGALLASG